MHSMSDNVVIIIRFRKDCNEITFFSKDCGQRGRYKKQMN